MAQTKLIGGGVPGSQSTLAQGVELAVDPIYQAARVALRPLDYSASGSLLGHYAVSQVSGAIAATPTALDPHASIRWAPSITGAFLVLMRLKVGLGVVSTVTAAVRLAYQASIARGFTVDYVTGSTAINLATVAKTNQMRGSMGGSQMGASGPRITTTGAMSGHTNTLDAAPFAITNFTATTNTPVTSTAVQMMTGSGYPMQTMYEWTGQGQHPVVLSNNEGVVVQLVHTGWATGTVSLYTQWEWCECVVF